jgi:alpha-L-rhamnosidase
MRNYKYTILVGKIILILIVVVTACQSDAPDKDLFALDLPIWTRKTTLDEPMVVFFRHKIETETLLKDVQIHIFADTRYEVWFDGVWVGRGPARFSQTFREYDVYHLGRLEAGQHLVAVMVQWAPNIRRSESATPFLMAHLQATTVMGKVKILASTEKEWLTHVPDAWQQNAAPVDISGLIGPTELLDLRLLPKDWNQPDFKDKSWRVAKIQNDLLENGVQQEEIVYRPRSIPQLANIPIRITVQDSGLLSPDHSIGELLSSDTNPYSLQISALLPTIFTLETLSNTQSSPISVTLDGNQLDWQVIGPRRPDVNQASIQLSSGAHWLSFSNIPSSGFAFAVSNKNVKFTNFPFQQGIHAGRRLLLSEPISASGQVDVSPGEHGITAIFTTLPAYLVLDLGRTTYGRLQADVNGPSGSVVDIGWDERLRTEALRPLPYPGSLYPEWNQVDSWILDGKSRMITTIDARAGRYILIAVWGTGSVELKNIQVLEESYPVMQVGSLHTSDPLLDKIWQVGVDSLHPNMTDAYTDTPWRERGLWWGDAYVENLVNQVAFGDTLLMRRDIDLMSDALSRDTSPGLVPNNDNQHILDYTMLWVDNVADYLQQTGDLSLIKETYPAIEQFMSYLETLQNPETGLLDLPIENWSRTAYIGSVGFDSRYGQSTALNSIYYNTLMEASSIAEQLDDATLAAKWRHMATQVLVSVNRLLYLPEKHRYLSSIYEGDRIAPSPHAQALPLAYGLVPESGMNLVADSLVEILSNDPSQSNIQPYEMFWVLDALGQAGHITQALDIIRLYYGYLLDRGATTWWENFNADQSQSASFSHGWGGSPTWFLTKYVLGASESSLNHWQVRPAFDSLSFASGSLPIGKNNLEVNWFNLDCGTIHLTVASDKLTQGDVILSKVNSDLRIVLDGELVWLAGKPLVSQVTNDENQIKIALPGGKHNLEMQWTCQNR